MTVSPSGKILSFRFPLNSLRSLASYVGLNLIVRLVEKSPRGARAAHSASSLSASHTARSLLQRFRCGRQRRAAAVFIQPYSVQNNCN